MKTKKRIFNMWQLLKDFLKTWHPSSYWHLSHKSYLEAYKYFFFIIALSFIGMILMGLPKFAILPDYLQSKMQSFDQLEVDLKVKMNSPIALTTREPEIIIDTDAKLANVSNALKHSRFIIHNTTLYYKLLFVPEKIELSKYKDLLKEKREVSTAIYFLIILAMPSIIVISFLIILLRYFIITHAAAVLGFALSRLGGYAIDFKTAFNSALYASTVMVLPELLLLPLLKPLFNVPIALFAILYLIVVIIECQKLRHRMNWGNM